MRSIILAAAMCLAVAAGCSSPGDEDDDHGTGGDDGVAGEDGAGPEDGGPAEDATTDDAGTTDDAEPPDDGTAPDDGGADDAGGPDCSVGEPIAGLTDETWMWVPFPDSVCGRGSTTGIGVNVSPDSRNLLVFLLGGGACYDASSCSPTCNPMIQLCAMFLDGFGESDLGDFVRGLSPETIFDRSAAANPFRDWDWVFVPYCTGDFHTGSTTATYGIRHQGFANLTAFLRRIVPTFCDAERVVLAGSSAGGFGAVFNYVHVKDAFAPLRVDLIDDSGPPMSPTWMPLQTTMRAAWGSAANDPPGCADCASGWDRWLPWLSATYPDARMSLLSSLTDPSIGPGFGGPIAAPDGFRTAINELADEVLGPLPNARVFYVDEFNHVYLKENLRTKTSLGVSLGTFLTRQIGDDPAWSSVRP